MFRRVLSILTMLATVATIEPSMVWAEPITDPGLPAEYADKVIVPLYRLLGTRLNALRDATGALAQSPSEANLVKARQAWREARAPWEWSEALLFGPVETYGYDPSLDTWPISLQDLDALLKGETAIDAALVPKLDPGVKGFHAVEYLLFGVDGQKTFSDLTPRELGLVGLLTTEMADTGQSLIKSWTEGVEGNPPYRELFVKADAASPLYASPAAVAEELVRGIMGIVGEVGDEKLGGPLEQQDPTRSESAYSRTSLDNFKDDIRGALYVYSGALPGVDAKAKGLDQHLIARDPSLNDRVMAGFKAALDALDAIPGPYETALLDPRGVEAIHHAQDVLAELHDLLEDEVLTALAGPRAGGESAEQLEKLAGRLNAALGALQAGDVEGAMRQYALFDDGWDKIEDGIKAKSRDGYRSIEDQMTNVKAALAKSPIDVDSATSALQQLRTTIAALLPSLR